MRRRWVMIDGELHEVTADHTAPPRGGGASGDAALWNDRIYQDGGDSRFTSRSQHRDFMRRHGLTTVDDFRETWRQAEARKVDFRQTGRDPTRKRDIVEAIHRLEAKRR
jgi:hypothetical protein